MHSEIQAAHWHLSAALINGRWMSDMRIRSDLAPDQPARTDNQGNAS